MYGPVRDLRYHDIVITSSQCLSKTEEVSVMIIRYITTFYVQLLWYNKKPQILHEQISEELFERYYTVCD